MSQRRGSTLITFATKGSISCRCSMIQPMFGQTKISDSSIRSRRSPGGRGQTSSNNCSKLPNAVVAVADDRLLGAGHRSHPGNSASLNVCLVERLLDGVAEPHGVETVLCLGLDLDFD